MPGLLSLSVARTRSGLRSTPSGSRRIRQRAEIGDFKLGHYPMFSISSRFSVAEDCRAR